MIHSQISNKVTTVQQQARPITLKAGQIFQGRITKLYPNNLAMLSINGMKVSARLEAALTSGQRYWFEVQGGTGIPRLRVLNENGTRSQAGMPMQSETLVEQLGISQSKGVNNLVRQLINQQIPFTRQAVLTGSQLLEELKLFNDKGIDVLLRMMERQLPLTKSSFMAFQATIDEPSISNQLQRLQSQLLQTSHPDAEKVNDLVSRLLKTDPFQQMTPIRQLLMSYVNQEGVDEKGGAEQLLLRLGVIKEEGSQARTYSEFQQRVLNPNNKEIVTQLWPNSKVSTVSQDAKNFFQSMMGQLTIPAGREGIPQLDQLLRLLGSNEEPIIVQEQWTKLASQQLSSAEKETLRLILNGSSDPKQMTTGSHFKSVLQMLGYQHEFDVNRFLQGELSKELLSSDRLKAMLLQLQREELPSALKEQVDKTILRLTGQQMFAQEQAGFHQLIMQIPLLLGTFQSNMTMQWEGKKDSKGEFDPDYCRILFYLTLERLDEVIVDVQIQNRVITVSVFNENAKPESLIDLLLPSLKESLKEQNYQLLSMKWEKMKDVETPKQSVTNPYLQHVNYEGVDVRI